MRILLPLFVLCLLLTVPRLTAAPDGDQAIPPGREVVISEFPLFPAPGPDGTWVELYNRSARTVDLGKAFLASNGHRLITFPKPFLVPGRSLVLVRFVSPRGNPWRAEPGPANSLVVESPAAVPVYGGKQRIKPGYLSLEMAVPNGLDRLLDYVRWGRFLQAADDSYQARAAKAGLWDRIDSKPLFVGLTPNSAGVPLPRGEMACVRLSFDPAFDQSTAWTLLALTDATPGQGNSSLPAPIPTPDDGSSVYAGDGLEAGCRLPFPLASEAIGEAGMFRFQLFRDPHLAQSVGTGEAPRGRYVFRHDLVPPGGYYLRCQWQVAGAATAWSSPIFVRVH